MPIDAAKAQELNERLSQEIFRSVKDFVTFYNSGLISKKHDTVKAIAHEITETFKDVREKNGQLTFISEEEILLEETLKALAPWTIIVKVKREVENALENKTITEKDTIVLDENGMMFYSVQKENGEEELKYVSNEKLFAKNDNIDLLISYSKRHNEETFNHYEGYAFNTTDITNIDTSFIEKIHNLIP